MDFFVARAMQIACLDRFQLERLHEAEKRRGYCFQNADIQTVFHLPTIKEFWCLPDDEAGQQAHAGRIKTLLLGEKVALSESFDGVDEGQSHTRKVVLPAWDAISTGRVPSTHRFDRLVQDAKDSGKIDFAYAGGNQGGSRLRDRAKSRSRLELVD